MKNPARLAAAVLAVALFAPLVPAQQAGQTTTRRRSTTRIYNPPKQQPPKTPPKTPPRGNDSTGAPKGDGGDGHTTTPPRPRPRPEPPRRRPPIGIVIDIGGGPGRQDEPKDKKDKPKKDKAKDDPVASSDPRPLKVDERAFRAMADGLLARGKVDSALRVVGLLKEQEYYEYTGELGDAIASSAAPPDYRDLVVRVASKSKKKKKDKEAAADADADKDAKKAKDDAGDGGSWEAEIERRADETLALEREARELRAVPEASRTKEQTKRLERVEADLAAASDDLDAFLDGLASDLGSKDPRVKNLRAAERLAGELNQAAPGTVAIYTLTTDERFWTIVVSPLGRTAYPTKISADELEKKVVAFRKVLVNPKQDPAPLARELYDVVLGRASADPAMASARTLLWSFDGVLRYVPAAALNDGTQYLVSRYRNVVFNRASVATLLDAPSTRVEGVGLGVARQIAPYAPLPAVADELSGIFAGSGLGVVPGRVLLDASFTEPALEAALGGDNAVVHIATHFQLSPTAADSSLLLLGDGNLVSVGAIRRIKGGFRGVDLLTLSACDTAASGPTSDGREVECFGTIAQERGAKAVIASLWPVNDRSTSLLMQTFYALRAKSPAASRAELLREAQLAVLSGKAAVPANAPARLFVQEEPEVVPGQPAFKTDPAAPFAHPYYWAPFVMIGSAT